MNSINSVKSVSSVNSVNSVSRLQRGDTSISDGISSNANLIPKFLIADAQPEDVTCDVRLHQQLFSLPSDKSA